MAVAGVLVSASGNEKRFESPQTPNIEVLHVPCRSKPAQ